MFEIAPVTRFLRLLLRLSFYKIGSFIDLSLGNKRTNKLKMATRDIFLRERRKFFRADNTCRLYIYFLEQE